MGSVANFIIILLWMSLIWGCASERSVGGSGTVIENELEINKAGKEVSSDSKSMSKDRPKDLGDLDQEETITNRPEKLKEELNAIPTKVAEGDKADAKEPIDPREVFIQELFSNKDENINVEEKVEDLNLTSPHSLLSETNHVPSENSEDNSSLKEKDDISLVNESEGREQDINDSNSANFKNGMALSVENAGDKPEKKPRTVQINFQQGEEPVTNPDVGNPDSEQNLIFKQPSFPSDPARKKDETLGQSLGLSDAFSIEFKPTKNKASKSTVSLSPAEEKTTTNGLLSPQQIRFSPSGIEKKVPDGSPPTQRLGLKPALADPAQKEISGLRRIAFEDKKNEDKDSTAGTNRLRVGFSGNSVGNSSIAENNLQQSVGFTNVTQDDDVQISKDIEIETKPFSRESRGYSNIQKFFGGVRSPSKSKQGYKQERKYTNLQDWSADERDQNRTNRAKGFQPKSFNRALKWIRQKGRVED
jgi:hypothetical protein